MENFCRILARVCRKSPGNARAKSPRTPEKINAREHAGAPRRAVITVGYDTELQNITGCSEEPLSVGVGARD